MPNFFITAAFRRRLRNYSPEGNSFLRSVHQNINVIHARGAKTSAFTKI
jgi:hypothetical protein